MIPYITRSMATCSSQLTLLERGKDMANHTEETMEFVAPLAVEYYNWLSGNGGVDPRELLAADLTESQRECLLDAMDDINVVYAITEPLRAAKRNHTPSADPAPPAGVWARRDGGRPSTN